MKTSRILLMLASFALAVGFVACNDKEPGPVYSPEAKFSGKLSSATRISDNGEEWTQSDRVGIFMINNGQPLSAGSIVRNADNIEYAPETAGSGVSTLKSIDPQSIIEYPESGSKVDFVAYSPYIPVLTDYMYDVNISDQSDLAAIDLIYAWARNNGSGYDGNSGTVELEFAHVLGRLNFTLVAGDRVSNEDLAGLKVEISDLYQTAEYDLGTRLLSNFGMQGTVTANTAANGLSSSLIGIPQTLSNSTLTVTLPTNAKFTWEFPAGAELKANEGASYSITVHNYGISVSSDGITDWAGKNDPAVTGDTQFRYKLGDYYPDPYVVYDNRGNVLRGAPAVGLVYALDESDPDYDPETETGIHGKVVHINSSGNIYWHVSFDYVTYEEAGASSMDDGMFNMRAVTSLPNWRDDYPAFAYVDSFNPSGTVYTLGAKGIWYFPSANEVVEMWCYWNGGDGPKDIAQRDWVDSRWERAGGGAMGGNWMWTSSEDLREGKNPGQYVLNYDTNGAFSTGALTSFGSTYKTISNSVRPIMLF